MKKQILTIAFLIVLMAFSGIAASTNPNSSLLYSSCKIDVSLVNQDPYPALPEGYVTVVFQVNGVQSPLCQGAKFQLTPSYPFSLDNTDSGLRILPTTTFMEDYNSPWMISYKLRIDKDAVEGDGEVNVVYSAGVWKDAYMPDKFIIPIKDARTSFDAVIQDYTAPTVLIAIANTGKNAANSVVVKLPEQPDFKVTGTNGQMAGNLASGDYTLVTFKVNPKNIPQGRNQTRTQPTVPVNPTELQFTIGCTDNIGVRRNVNMSLPLAAAANSTALFGRNTTQKTWYTDYTTLGLIAVIVILVAFMIIKKIWKGKKKPAKDDATTPQWIKKGK